MRMSTMITFGLLVVAGCVLAQELDTNAICQAIDQDIEAIGFLDEVFIPQVDTKVTGKVLSRTISFNDFYFNFDRIVRDGQCEIDQSKQGITITFTLHSETSRVRTMAQMRRIIRTEQFVVSGEAGRVAMDLVLKYSIRSKRVRLTRFEVTEMNAPRLTALSDTRVKIVSNLVSDIVVRSAAEVCANYVPYYIKQHFTRELNDNQKWTNLISLLDSNI